ncbi:MAG TPA: hypothetical protein VNJ51_09680 [Candidatus Dormibacteraeota bacterium]|nr:hypothetical protein [Candidatus Dormibacteraeota bacterium]
MRMTYRQIEEEIAHARNVHRNNLRMPDDRIVTGVFAALAEEICVAARGTPVEHMALTFRHNVDQLYERIKQRIEGDGSTAG